MQKNINNMLEIGTIVGPRGLKGEVKVLSSTDFPERFEVSEEHWMRDPSQSSIQLVKLINSRYVANKNIYVVRLQGIETRDQAEILRNHKLLVTNNSIPKLGKEEYHMSQLVNLKAYHIKTKKLIGIVTDIFTTGHDLLEIKLNNLPLQESDKEQKILIPFVYEIVPVVDLKNKRIEINPPKGLLELSTVK
ncbi:ribosome maturation factor RimM [Candidatus Atelocyanobacterium thalassae]|uniref:Ribosome maturation factor RimM n=1 Tax=cyanobacterium endosymbiont of Braarudosphaera bigelowii TaxID=1285375 RepID=A0ABM7U4A0_9CHRO|nr:ribosome maturation factor RimM [Candidatus Atelocyanobacterium thalassa]BDA39526.1 ribosome maturation factor RimM [cyanobacterium endosymbiont of Braarudosphaera bigelowii]